MQRMAKEQIKAMEEALPSNGRRSGDRGQGAGGSNSV